MKKIIIILTSLLALSANAEGEKPKNVFISPGVLSIDIIHQGQMVKLQRN